MTLRTLGDLPEITAVEVNPETMAAYARDADFLSLTVEPLKETGSYVCYAASMTDETGTWSRDQAIIGGNMVRLYKLTHAILDQTCQGRGELAFVFFRLAFETIVNIRYLIKHFSPDLTRSYVTYSLKHERKLLELIGSNIAQRNGVVKPIEDRMLKSLHRAAAAAGVTYDEVDQRQKNWGNKTTFAKAEDIEWAGQYQAAFAGPSHNVHGNWQEIYSNHLTWDGNDRFTPNLEFSKPRPQPLFALCFLATEALRDFYEFKAGTAGLECLWPPVADLQGRILAADQGHEGYLARKQWPEV